MKNYKIKIAALSAGLLALTLAITPLAGFAKEKGENGSKVKSKVELRTKAVKVANDDSKIKDGERKENKGYAFGHLIAPGWLKNFGSTTSTSSRSWLPHGIAKKMGLVGTSTASTTDATAPMISSIATEVDGEDEVVIRWKTNERSDSTVYYGTSTPIDVNSTSTLSVKESALVRGHEVEIEDLTASTTYYFRVGSKDAAGNVSYSGTLSFTTGSSSPDTTGPIISGVTAFVGTSTMSFNWMTDEPATTKVYFGLPGAVDPNSTTTSFVSNGSLTTNHSIAVSGLATSTLYNFVLESKDGSGNRTLSGTYSQATSF